LLFCLRDGWLLMRRQASYTSVRSDFGIEREASTLESYFTFFSPAFNCQIFAPTHHQSSTCQTVHLTLCFRTKRDPFGASKNSISLYTAACHPPTTTDRGTYNRACIQSDAMALHTTLSAVSDSGQSCRAVFVAQAQLVH